MLSPAATWQQWRSERDDLPADLGVKRGPLAAGFPLRPCPCSSAPLADPGAPLQDAPALSIGHEGGEPTGKKAAATAARVIACDTIRRGPYAW